MNREIKFRAWLEGTHEDLTFSQPHMQMNAPVVDGYYADVEAGWDIHGTYKTIPLMQYTGLKDKNGVEIYEGDLLTELGHVKVVEWSGEGLGWVFQVVREFKNNYSASIEVIGNIYENSELLSES